MRAALLLTLALATGCTPDETTCQRLVVSDILAQHHWAVVGETVTVMVASPLTSCVSDTLRAEARLFDPDNAEVPVRVGDVTASGRGGAATTTVEFTPSGPGTWSLQVAFEPSLGVRSALIDVVDDGSSRPHVLLPRPSGCDFVWALDDGTIACEAAVGGVQLSRGDGGLSAFEGAELVVAGDVLWSLNAQVLERRRFVDGGLALTHTFPGFAPRATPSINSETTALRLDSSGTLSWIELTDGGVPRVSQVLPPPTSAPVYFVDDGVRSYVSNFRLEAIEPEVVWISEAFPADGVAALARPHDVTASRVARLEWPHERSPPLQRAAERIPLWLDVELTQGRKPLAEVRDGALQLVAWPRLEVLHVGRTHLVLRDEDPNRVRVYRK